MQLLALQDHDASSDALGAAWLLTSNFRRLHQHPVQRVVRRIKLPLTAMCKVSSRLLPVLRTLAVLIPKTIQTRNHFEHVYRCKFCAVMIGPSSRLDGSQLVVSEN